MESNLISVQLQVDGMTCSGCELRIENALKRINGVNKVSASYSRAVVDVSYNSGIVGLDSIISTIEGLDYSIRNKPDEQPDNIAPKGNKPKNVMRKVLQLTGMSGIDSEKLIEGSIKKLKGVIDVNVMFSSSNAYVTYDSSTITLEQIASAIEKLGGK